MGGSLWSKEFHEDRMTTLRATGKSGFDHHDTIKSKPVEEQVVHELLNPMGLKVREARDSDAHPESLPISVWLDVTGSMQGVPLILQDKLGGLMALLLKKGYVDHPQIQFCAIGDATSDRVPIQVGQFESGNEMVGDLSRFFLEGNGGGQMPPKESYEMAAYITARHTSTDAWEKRRNKGYLFIIGDENPYPEVDRDICKRYLGSAPEADIPVQQIFDEVMEKWNVFMIIPKNTYHGKDDTIRRNWSKILGERVIVVEHEQDIPETIALTIGLAEGRTDLDAGVADLEEVGGASAATAKSVSTALAHVAKSGLVKPVDVGILPEVAGGTGSAKRL